MKKPEEISTRDLLKTVANTGIIPVIAIEDASKAVPLAKALAAGAKFIVSPGYNEELVNFCIENGVPVFPGGINTKNLIRK